MENNSLSDRIYFYNEDEQDILVSELQPEKLPHLIIATGQNSDLPLTDLLAKKGLTYGKRFMTFHREYFSYCEKLLYKLGK